MSRDTAPVNASSVTRQSATASTDRSTTLPGPNTGARMPAIVCPPTLCMAAATVSVTLAMILSGVLYSLWRTRKDTFAT